MIQTETGKLLVVDDEEPNRDLLSRRLRKAGFAVECAASAQEALEALDKTRIDLVLLDNMMPGMSGIDLLKLLRATQSPSELPVIMVTALHDSHRVVEALSIGANDYVTKPIDFPVTLARVEAQLARLRSDRRLTSGASSNNEGPFEWNLESDELFVDERWKQISGLEEWTGKTGKEWLARISGKDAERIQRDLAQVDKGARFETEYRLGQTDGSCRWILLRGSISSGGRHLTGAIIDVTLTKAYDSLTALGNRHTLLHWLEDNAAGATLLLVSLDRFKLVHESLGAGPGEKLIEEIAIRLKTTLSQFDPEGLLHPPRLARLEGELFAVLINSEQSGDYAESLAKLLIAVIEKPLDVKDRKLYTSANIGFAVARAATLAGEQLLFDASTALGQARLAGRGQVVEFDDTLRSVAINEMELEGDLRMALDRKELEVYYQAKIDLSTRRISGFEALLRWKHPVRGMVPPDTFIPIAENSGLILPIGQWVLEEACSTMADWRQMFPERPELEVSVNVSAYQIRDGKFAERVQSVLAQTGLAPQALQLEITESVFIADTRNTQSTFQRLRSLGVDLNLDDFGTGYSSLQYLNNLRFDALKIDKSFLKNLPADEASSELVRSMVGIARSLEMEVVAEGVETAQQLEQLKSMGCEYGQGYLFSRPVPAAQALQLLREESASASTIPKE